jgi:hypothetical protein
MIEELRIAITVIKITRANDLSSLASNKVRQEGVLRKTVLIKIMVEKYREQLTLSIFHEIPNKFMTNYHLSNIISGRISNTL